MSNASKQKGTAFERAVQDYLIENGIPTNRQPPAGRNDVGDLHTKGGCVIECKATKEIALAAAVDEAQIEAKRAGKWLGVAIIKRRNRPISHAYVVMPLEDFTKFFGDLL